MIAEFFAEIIEGIYSPPPIGKKTAANKSPFFYLFPYSSPARIGEDWRGIQKRIPDEHLEPFESKGTWRPFSPAGISHPIISLGCGRLR